MTTETPQLGYTLWAVLRRDPARTAEGPIEDLAERLAVVQKTGVVVRGLYDTSGVKADSDLMIWLHGPDPQRLQWALRELRRSPLLSTLLPTWNALGVHRDAEFSASHLPAYLRDTEPKRWMTVYPFVRSYEWYLLPEEDRRRMLAEHGKMGRDFPQVLANTVASFALGDYEWLLGLEADDLVDLVDLMRHLRYVDARLHVREEIPFYTGRRIELAELPEVLA
ncbi:MAG TPA: hydrogen peroxide-dependent heme synthase [Terrimesophilobacter sp.]|uniref:hydrogen peroxide-dependent heme synthase n=1 Tax=Terrimesophilobacter sp. TaxID=2906435 RepID=UPI002F9481B1